MRYQKGNNQFIVKVQISLFTSEGAPQVLIYNKDESVMYTGDAPKDIKKKMRGQFKAFFFAEIKRRKLTLYNRAPAQSW